METWPGQHNKKLLTCIRAENPATTKPSTLASKTHKKGVIN